MNQRSGKLKKRIMRRVYFMWFTRTILSALALEIAIFVVVFVGAQSYMSIAHVWQNAVVRLTAYPLTAFGRFWLEALSNSELALKLLLAAALLSGVLVMRHALHISRRLAGNILRFPRVI